MNEMAEVFEHAPLHQLASGWIGCVVDAYLLAEQTGEFSLAGYTRSLTTVAERLHGLKFETTITIPGALLMNTPIAKAEDAAFVVMDGPPPASKTAGEHDPLSIAIAALKPGQFIACDPAKIKRHQVSSRVNKVRKTTGNKNLHSYIATDGKIIVIHEKH